MLAALPCVVFAGQSYLNVEVCGNDWKWIQPWPDGEDKVDIELTSAGLLIYEAENGRAIRTFDFGKHWEVLHYCDASDSSICGLLNSGHVSLVDSNTLYTWSGRDIYISTNGGLKWRLQSHVGSALVLYNTLGSLTMVTPAFGWLFSNKYDSINKGYIYFTYDSARHWNLMHSDTGQGCVGMSFVDSLHGWGTWKITSKDRYGGYLRRTSDGGRTWETLITDTGTGPNHLEWYHTPTFYDTLHAVGYNYHTKFEFTSDGGVTWKPFYSQPLTKLTYTWRVFGNGTVTKALCPSTASSLDSFQVETTNDFGIHWVRKKATVRGLRTSVENNGARVYIESPQRIIVMGSFGDLVITEDSGKTWNTDNSLGGWHTQGVYFADNNRGFLYGATRDHYRSSGLLTTRDGGWSWIESGFPDSSAFYLSMTTAHCLYVGNYDTLVKSTDLGVTFSPLPSLPVPEGTFASTVFADSLHGWIFGAKDGAWYTSDGGEHWRLTRNERTLDPQSFLFSGACTVNNTEAWLVEDTLLHTTDAGLHWSVDTVSDLSGLGAIAGIVFPTAKHGYISGVSTSYETTDGGKTWFASAAGSTYCMNFKDSLFGWTSARLTSDGGKSWTERTCWADYKWWFDTSHAWGFNPIGNYGISRYGDSVNLSSVQEQDIQPLSFLKVYPNPSSDVTTITFNRESNVAGSANQLVICNILGEQVLDLSSQVQQTGSTGEIKVHFSQLPMGIYFARMRSGSQMQMQRLVVAK